MHNVLSTILNSMDACIYISDLTTDEILFINNRMMQASGLSGDVVGQTCWKALHAGQSDRCSFCPKERLTANPDAAAVWKTHNAHTGHHYKYSGSIIEWVNGDKVYMQHCIDITDILNAQKATLIANERLEIALASSRAGVWELFLDKDRFVYDPMCAKLLCIDPQTDSMTITELIAHFEQVLRIDPSSDFLEKLRERNPYFQQSIQELHISLPDGTERHVRYSGYAIRNPSVKAQRVVGMCIDITRHVNMEKELTAAKEIAENASRAKSQFLSNMSHEIRTPMNAIIGIADILLNDELNERQRSYLTDIKISSTALLGIINDILDFSKIEAGKLQLIPVDFDIFQMLENIQSMFSFAAAEKNLFFYMDILEKLPQYIYGDDIRLRQVLINILGNAVKFTRAGGVTLLVGLDDDMLSFEIADTGIGIKPEHISSLFKDFTQLDTRNNREIAGTGLGLSITKNLIAMMNGTISVESEYGKGSTFRIRIPLVRGNRKKAHTARMFKLVEAPEAAVLVVDDNEINLHVAAGLLRLFGIVCDTASNGWDAIRKAAGRKYDIVFMDHMMPQLDGVETTKALREQPGGRELAIIALTANAADGVKEMLLGSQMDDYLSKPIDNMELNRILRAWLPPEKVRDRRSCPAAAETKPEASDLLFRIREMEEIDVELGLSYNGDSQEIYEQSLRIMSRRLPEAMAKLLFSLEQGDARNFTVEIHGVKGSLANLGIARLAKIAGGLESDAREGGMELCRERLPALIEDLRKLYSGLTSALAAGEPQKAAPQTGTPNMLQSKMPGVRKLLDAFEGDLAADALRELMAHDFGSGPNEALRHALRAVEEFDYDGALAKLDGL